MLICRRPLILGIDLVGGTLVCAALAAALWLVVLPLQRSLSGLPALRRDAQTARQQHSALVARNATNIAALSAREALLLNQGQQPLADPATFLEQMAQQCAANNITLRQVNPLQTTLSETHASWQVRVEAAGQFPDFARWLAQVESWSPFIQISDLTIGGPGSAADACRLACTIRVNYLRPADPDEDEPS